MRPRLSFLESNETSPRVTLEDLKNLEKILKEEDYYLERKAGDLWVLDKDFFDWVLYGLIEEIKTLRAYLSEIEGVKTLERAEDLASKALMRDH